MPATSPEAIQRKRDRDNERRRENGWRSGPRGKTLHEQSRKPILAIDGEGTGLRRHNYVLIGTSDGDYLHVDHGSIPLEMACDWILDRGHNRLIVTYAFNYDVSMLLREIPRNDLRYLYEHGFATVQLSSGPYTFTYWPGKRFTIKRGRDDRSVTIFDHFGYYQSSFVKAIETEGVTDPFVEAMKAKRGLFRRGDPKLIDYCIRECELQAEYMSGPLRERLKAVGIYPGDGRFYGPGAIATTVLDVHGIKDHHMTNADLGRPEAVLGAFFGGRIDCAYQGSFSTLYGYDIRSAYPAALSECPSLAYAKLERVRRDYAFRGFTLVHCRWKATHKRVAPFPLRAQDGTVWWTKNGSGWYHGIEVKAAIDSGLAEIEIDEVLQLKGYDPDVKPFQFVHEYYAERSRAKARGESNIAYKLALNSLYGKTAQKESFSRGRSWTPPRYQQHFWAGYITARTRAEMLRAIGQYPNMYVWANTDGLVMKRPLDLPTHDALGAWEEKIVKDMIVIQPGVYQAHDDHGNEIDRRRGFTRSEIKWPEVRERWEAGKPYAVFDTRRFIGIPLSLHLNRPIGWDESTRMLVFKTERKNQNEIRRRKLNGRYRIVRDEHERSHSRDRLTLKAGGWESIPYDVRLGPELDEDEAEAELDDGYLCCQPNGPD